MSEDLEALANEVRFLLTSNDHQPESVAPLLGGKHHGELMPVCRRNLRVEIDNDLWRLYRLSFGNADILIYKHSSLDERELHDLFPAWAGSYILENEDPL